MSAAPATTLADRARAGVSRSARAGSPSPSTTRRPGARQVERVLALAAAATTLTERPAPRPTSGASVQPAHPPRTERTRRAPDLRALPTRSPLHRGVRLALLLTGMAVMVVGILGIVALNALAAEASFEARTLERDIAELTLRHDDLVAEVATLAGPARVREVATTRLGMMAPEAPGFLTLDPADMPAPPYKPLRPLGDTPIGG